MNIDPEKVRNGYQCPYCGAATELIDTKEIYGKSYGLAMICRPCDAYVSCHEGTDQPKGRVANKELRIWKTKAHQYFDPLWRWKMRKDNVSKTKARKAAYAWLAKELRMPVDECHIGMFDTYRCKRVVAICRRFKTPPS